MVNTPSGRAYVAGAILARDFAQFAKVPRFSPRYPTTRRLFAERESIAERLAAMSQNHAAVVASNAVLHEEVHQQRVRLEAAADIYDCAMQRVRELEAANK